MHYYSPNSPQNISDTNEVDERWDSNLGYSSHREQSYKDQPLESKFQNLNLSKEVISPPLTSNINKGVNELSSGFFKEDIDQDNYFQSYESPVVITPTVEECDYLTTKDAIHDNPRPSRKRNLDNDQDFSITSVNEEILPIESLQSQKEYRTPVSLEAYHSDLIQYYTTRILQLLDIKMDNLPKAYTIYIDHIKNSCYKHLPNSL